MIHPLKGVQYTALNHTTQETVDYIYKDLNHKLNALTLVTSFDKELSQNQRTLRDLSPNSKQNTSIHATFSTNAHILIDMWKSINDQLEALKLDNRN